VFGGVGGLSVVWGGRFIGRLEFLEGLVGGLGVVCGGVGGCAGVGGVGRGFVRLLFYCGCVLGWRAEEFGWCLWGVYWREWVVVFGFVWGG